MKWKRGLKPVSFDALDWLYLEDYEGNFQLASEPYFKATELAPGVWSVLTDGDYTYVLEGDDEAVCIDSGCGAGDIRAFCQTLTDKPVYRILNTHGHWDHTCNNYLFDAVYMSEKAYPDSSFKFGFYRDMDIPTDYPVVFMKEGDVFNLEGRPLEVLNGENHAMGSLQFLDRRSRILFIGDEVHGNFLDCNAPVEHVKTVLEKFMAIRPYYDRIAAGCGVFDASYIDRYLEIVNYILDGHEDEGEADFPPFADVVSSVVEYNGKTVNHRRCPHPTELAMAFGSTPEGKALMERWGGRAAIGMGRRLNPEGIWDRRMIRNGCTVHYYLNRIRGKLEDMPFYR